MNINNMSKDELINLRDKLEKSKKMGVVLSSVSTTSLIITLLSPFDFEGPVAEIISAILLASGVITKSISDNKIKKLEMTLEKRKI